MKEFKSILKFVLFIMAIFIGVSLYKDYETNKKAKIANQMALHKQLVESSVGTVGEYPDGSIINRENAWKGNPNNENVVSGITAYYSNGVDTVENQDDRTLLEKAADGAKSFGKSVVAFFSFKDVEEKELDLSNATMHFDDRLLMYEGTNNSYSAKGALEVLKADADDKFYYKPKVIAQNFSGVGSVEIEFTDAKSYKNAIQSLINNVKDGTNYEISFEYGALNAIANTVIIKQK